MSDSPSSSMRAVRFHRYGPPEVLACESVTSPRLSAGHVLVDVHAAGVNPVDWRYRQGQLRWIDWARFPRIPGADVAGTIRAAAADVSDFAPGDRVFAMLDTLRAGAYAEQVAVPADQLAHVPESISLIDAAGIPLVACTAIQALRDLAQLQPGEQVLINGASGGVGTVAVQWAAHRQAIVTGVCSHRNTDLVRTLGAEQVIDYTRHDITTQSAAFDVVFDAFGNLSLADARPILRPGGRFVTTDITPTRLIEGLTSRLRLGPRSQVVVVKPSGADMQHIADLLESGALRPVTDRTFPLCEAAAAHRYSETKRAQGKIVLVTDRGAE